MTVHVRRDLHLRDLRLLLQAGEVHAAKTFEVGPDYPHRARDIEEVVCTIRLCPDAQRYIDRVVRKARRDTTG